MHGEEEGAELQGRTPGKPSAGKAKSRGNMANMCRARSIDGILWETCPCLRDSVSVQFLTDVNWRVSVRCLSSQQLTRRDRQPRPRSSNQQRPCHWPDRRQWSQSVGKRGGTGDGIGGSMKAEVEAWALSRDCRVGARACVHGDDGKSRSWQGESLSKVGRVHESIHENPYPKPWEHPGNLTPRRCRCGAPESSSHGAADGGGEW